MAEFSAVGTFAICNKLIYEDYCVYDGRPRVMREILLGAVFGFFTVLHNVAGLEEDPLQHLPPDRFLAEQKLQVHSEVFELLLLSVLHNRLRFGVFLNRDSLLIPTDGFGFFDDRSDHSGERAYFFREFGRWLVVLIKSHRSMVA